MSPLCMYVCVCTVCVYCECEVASIYSFILETSVSILCILLALGAVPGISGPGGCCGRPELLCPLVRGGVDPLTRARCPSDMGGRLVT